MLPLFFIFDYAFSSSSQTSCPSLQPCGQSSLTPLLVLFPLGRPRGSPFLCFFKSVLAQAADGADPIFGNVFPLGAGSNAVFGITGGRIILITTGAQILFHNHFSLSIERWAFLSRSSACRDLPVRGRDEPRRGPFHGRCRGWRPGCSSWPPWPDRTYRR